MAQVQLYMVIDVPKLNYVSCFTHLSQTLYKQDFIFKIVDYITGHLLTFNLKTTEKKWYLYSEIFHLTSSDHFIMNDDTNHLILKKIASPISLNQLPCGISIIETVFFIYKKQTIVAQICKRGPQVGKLCQHADRLVSIS